MKNNKPSVLIVDDEKDMLMLLSKWLTASKYQVETAESGEEAYEKFTASRPALIVTDLIMGGMDGLELLSKVHDDDPLQPVILLSGQAKIPDAIKATHLGSAAFLLKPIGKEEFLENVRNNLRLYRHANDEIFHKRINYQSKVMQETVELSQVVAESNVTVMLLGETGTGKEIFARAIHDSGHRKNKRFIAVNCGALPGQLLESELFGHVKGAFTGASSKNEGLFMAANEGTLFLDEIGDMDLTLQVKLLRVLQDFEVRPVGSSKSYPVDVRIISATHRDLEDKVESGEFRQDLYYRLKVVSIKIPTLAERKEDIPLLADEFLNKYSQANSKSRKRFAPNALAYLCSLRWPGNIRQLMNVVDLCATLCKTDIISLTLAKKASQEKTGKILTLKEARNNFEKNYLNSVLRITGGHVANSAKIAGRNRTEFYKLLSQYGLNAAEYRKSKNK